MKDYSYETYHAYAIWPFGLAGDYRKVGKKDPLLPGSSSLYTPTSWERGSGAIGTLFSLPPPPCSRYPGRVSLKTTKTGSSLTKKGVRGGSFLAIILKKGVLGSPGGHFGG